MSGKYFVVMMCVVGLCLLSHSVFADTAFINEIHYDNMSTDIGEGFEVSGNAGLDLSGWQVLLLNGGTGAMYGTINLSGVIPEQQNGFGSLSFMRSGIQNGPDGLALIDDLGSVVQFLSYEGSFTAVEGPVVGLESIDIGVEESNASTAVGFSLQLTGTGSQYSDFAWINPQENSFGTINYGQTFAAVPLPPALVFIVPGLVGLIGLRKKRKL